MYQQTVPWQANYDPAEIPPYQLPDLLGSITSAAEWSRTRRPELLKMFRETMYGNPPPLPDKTDYTVIAEKTDALNGQAVRREIRIDFRMNGGRRHSVIALLYLPILRTGKVPVFVNLTFGGNQVVTEEDDIFMTGLAANRGNEILRPGSQTRRYPLPEILSRGYALIIASYHDFFPDFADGWGGSIYQLFRHEEELKTRPADASAIAAWAWGFSRLLDCAARQPEIDGTRAAVIGHSRLGKSALWAGVQDERFGLVCVNDSGCGGAAPNRRLFGETLYFMCHCCSFGKTWFNTPLQAYAEHPEALPFDQHELIALAAPRAVAVHSATEDLWADPDGEYEAAYAASPVWTLFGKKGLISPTAPAPDTAAGEDVSYFRRTGPHDLLLSDWQHYMDAADRVFKRQQN